MTNNIKTARYLGISQLIDVNTTTYIYLCRSCDGMFNAMKELSGKIVNCPCCKEKILLENKK